MKDKREYKVFESNRVAKIREHSYLKWNYVPTRNNPADLGSQGCELRKLCEFWWNGPEWLGDCKNWPEQPDNTNNDESEKARKMVNELLATTVDLQNPIDTFLNKFTLRKTLRILSSINRFLNNCRNSKVSGPLTADRILVQRKFLIKREQNLYSNTENFEIRRQQLNLKPNEEGIYECHGRYPVFISNKSVLAEKLVEETHLQTVQGGVTLTMARIRDQSRIPTLRQLVKRIIQRCYGCKRRNISHYPKPSQGLIPTERTKQDLPFSVIRTDYAGSFICKTKGKRDIKYYLLLFTCSLTRAVNLELLPNQTTREFIQALKRLIASRGRSKVIFPDNTKTFEKASKWIKRVYKDEGMEELLVTEQVK